MPKGRKDGMEKGEFEENLVPVYVASEGYVTRCTWCSHGRFSSLRVLSRDSLSPLFIAISTYRHPSSGDALPRKWYVRVRRAKPMRCRSSTANPSFRPMDHAQIYFLEIPQEFRGKSARVPDFSGGMYRNMFDIMYFQWLRKKFFENSRLRVWERKGSCKFYESWILT